MAEGNGKGMLLAFPLQVHNREAEAKLLIHVSVQQRVKSGRRDDRRDRRVDDREAERFVHGERHDQNALYHPGGRPESGAPIVASMTSTVADD